MLLMSYIKIESQLTSPPHTNSQGGGGLGTYLKIYFVFTIS